MKKKIVFAILTIAICVFAFGIINASAETYGDLTYKTSGGKVTITDCNENATTVVIPETIEGCPVTSIGISAFEYCTMLTSITIPDSVTSIGDNVFSGCSGLTSITIPDSVTYVGRYAFRHCTGLANITLPDSITSIDYGAFYDCTGLTSIIIPDSVTSVGKYAFCNCTGLTNITIPDSVTSIGSSAFSGCTGLTSIIIPDSVTSIGYGAFSNCTGLTDIIIPDSVTSIGDEAFYNCSELASITIGNSVTYIGDSAFFGCESLTSITIPNSVNSIDDEVFCNCSGLTSIIISDSVTSIGDRAFSCCTGLTSITIPDSVTSIGEGAFSGCKGLTNIIIPDSVTYIGNSAFTKCTNLNSVTIGKGIESVPRGAFYRCDNLRYVCIPKNVKHIGDGAFGNYIDIQKVFYEGSKDEWIKTSFSESNKNLTSAKIIYNSTKRTYRFETNTEEKLTDIIGYAVFEAPEPKNEGKTFVGWYDNPEWDGEDISLPYYGENTTLYAKWTDKTGFTFEEAFTARENKVYTVTSNLEQTIYYKFVPKFTGEYRVYSTGSYDTCGYLFDSNQAQLTYDDDDGDSNNFLITYNLTAGETYYIAAKVYIGSGTFDLMIETDLSKSKKSVCVTAFTGEKVYITVPANLPEDAKIILSCYKGNTMTDMQVADNSYEAISFVTQAEFDTAKVLAWESFESIKPLCTAEKLVFETNTNPDDDLEFE